MYIMVFSLISVLWPFKGPQRQVRLHRESCWNWIKCGPIWWKHQVRHRIHILKIRNLGKCRSCSHWNGKIWKDQCQNSIQVSSVQMKIWATHITSYVVPRKHFFKTFRKFWSIRFRISGKYWRNVFGLVLLVVSE